MWQNMHVATTYFAFLAWAQGLQVCYLQHSCLVMHLNSAVI